MLVESCNVQTIVLFVFLSCNFTNYPQSFLNFSNVVEQYEFK